MGMCRVCGREIALTADDRVHRHNDPHSSVWPPEACPGWGKFAVDIEATVQFRVRFWIAGRWVEETVSALDGGTAASIFGARLRRQRGQAVLGIEEVRVSRLDAAIGTTAPIQPIRQEG